MPLLRGLVVPLSSPLPPALLSLLADYRLLTNEILREALASGKTARGAVSRFARDRAFVHQLTGQHAVVAADIALSLAKGHRRRIRQGLHPRVPYVRRLFLRTNPQTFHLDSESGKVRLSLRNGEWCSFFLPLSRFHRDRLGAEGARIQQLQVSPDRAVLFLERPAPEPYDATALLALDTNESSLDGVSVDSQESRLVQVPFSELRRIQAIHYVRRRKLAQKKAHDRRVARRVLRKEGRRERHRIRSRLHGLTTRLLDTIARHHAALALEDLSRMPTSRRRASPRTRRRLSSWPVGNSIASSNTRRRTGGSRSTG